MLKKVLIFVAAVALVVWVVSWFRADDAVATSAARTWPGGMGPLESAERRWPALKPNDGSRKLTALANALPKSEAMDEYVRRELARGELAIGEPPAAPPDLSVIRELLLREPIVWETQDDIGNAATDAMRVVQLTVARALVASALAKARSGDATAWDDLHATWRLARALDGHPQMSAQTAALTTARMINAAAWRMPLPVPQWFGEVQARDELRPLLAAYQHQTASYWEDGAQFFPTKFLAESVEHDRLIAEQLFATTGCDVNMPMNKLGTDLSSVWRRAFRYRAEREATANALRIREGKPIETSSRCSDGTWTFDGTTLRFSRPIPTPPPDRPLPLTLRVGSHPQSAVSYSQERLESGEGESAIGHPQPPARPSSTVSK
jgi:hypothetical protein